MFLSHCHVVKLGHISIRLRIPRHVNAAAGLYAPDITSTKAQPPPSSKTCVDYSHHVLGIFHFQYVKSSGIDQKEYDRFVQRIYFAKQLKLRMEEEVSSDPLPPTLDDGQTGS